MYVCVCMALTMIATINTYLAYARNSLDTLFNLLPEIDNEETNRKNRCKGIEKIAV